MSVLNDLETALITRLGVLLTTGGSPGPGTLNADGGITVAPYVSVEDAQQVMAENRARTPAGVLSLPDIVYDSAPITGVVAGNEAQAINLDVHYKFLIVTDDLKRTGTRRTFVFDNVDIFNTAMFDFHQLTGETTDWEWYPIILDDANMILAPKLTAMMFRFHLKLKFKATSS